MKFAQHKERMIKLKKRFGFYLSYFNEHSPFSGPSEYFYKKYIIKHHKSLPAAELYSRDFYLWVYATLASWGMHRMGPEGMGAKMADFPSFEACLQEVRQECLELSDVQIDAADLRIRSLLEKMFLKLHGVMRSKSCFVAHSKILHFLLPNLVPPMDRQYTVNFFGKGVAYKKGADASYYLDKDASIFLWYFDRFCELSSLPGIHKYLDDGFSPTIPKVIDNAIVGFILKER